MMICLMGISCSRPQEQEAKTELSYPQPRYPRYLVNPNSEDLLAAARFAVRQPTGRSPLGIAQSGQTAHVLLQWGQDPQVWDAIQKAWAERGVEAHALWVWDVMGISKEEYYKKMDGNIVHGNEAWKEAGIFLFQDYRHYFSEDIQKQFGNPIVDFQIIDPYLNDYLDKHPEVKNIFGANGGGVFFIARLKPPHKDKFKGNYIYYRPVDLLSKGAEFPADVWSLVDEKILRPVPFVSEVTFQDPEGTNLHWTVSPEQAQYWSTNAGASNHIYIYPSPLHSTFQEGGVLAAHSNHTGIYPTMTVHLDRYGSVQEIEGGGRTAEMFRYLLNHPAFQDVKFPKSPAPGYWFFRQDGFATNPKFVRSFPGLIEGDTFLPNAVERNRAGIQHLAFAYGSNEANEDPEDVAYAKKKGVPLGNGQHNFHMHVYFPTAQWKLRDTGEWITVAEKGYVKMYDDPEVRALASRYGDPDLILRYEWIPSIPGVNLVGDYQKDFAADPWSWLMAEWKKIQDGTYTFFVDDYAMENRQVAQTSDRP
ncbi:MAG: hypothetical protein HY649_01765 [Acidobacteria bacterium]|nr:hypothetical protein [Acidobacteriota bacterium]